MALFNIVYMFETSEAYLLFIGVHRSLLCFGGLRSQRASNELYDAYRPENGYFGDLMNGVGATRHYIGRLVIICLK
ncbi:hypothetical protein GCM10008018_34400 [Paenibacillus marchantiophytorum]|uniref:Uncharacterized protein n=1 Tax=Paenibacillus marchantiophytorum TaxID=1619310 RepID=A0ABQ1ESY4_9BACL|nr:hypothetical protein GCM10008018_34400 [Paenibacillus marchantiophytorum]